jgi:hypothetical protein
VFIVQTVWQDLRHAARMLWKQPGFSVVAIVTLALGIGANTAIFSVVNAVILRPLPFPHAEQLVIVRDDLSARQVENIGLSVDELRDFQERSGVFDKISAVWPVDANLTGSDRPERIELLAVSPNYFSLLGAGAQVGRVFGPQDQAQGVVDTDRRGYRSAGSAGGDALTANSALRRCGHRSDYLCGPGCAARGGRAVGLLHPGAPGGPGRSAGGAAS